MSTQTKKNSPTNPFVYVIAAAVIAVLSLGLRFLVDALDSNNDAIAQETEIKNLLVPKKATKEVAPTTVATGTATGTAETPSGAMAK